MKPSSSEIHHFNNFNKPRNISPPLKGIHQSPHKLMNPVTTMDIQFFYMLLFPPPSTMNFALYLILVKIRVSNWDLE